MATGLTLTCITGSKNPTKLLKIRKKADKAAAGMASKSFSSNGNMENVPTVSSQTQTRGV